MSGRTRVQLASVWAGPVFLVTYAIAFWGIAGWMPPSDPTLSADQVADIYAGDRTGIRVGLILSMVSATLLFPYFAMISRQIASIEGGRFSPLAMMQFGAGTLLIVFFDVCLMLWVGASFRSTFDPDTVRTLHDVAWLMFVMVFPGYCLQMICQSVAGFLDTSEHPTWPRWAAWMNLWVAFSGMGGGLAVFFKDGPFAWNGLIGFWAPITIFAIWLCVTTYLLRAAVQREAAAEAETVTDDAVAMTRA
jgi:hypothetical protein